MRMSDLVVSRDQAVHAVTARGQAIFGIGDGDGDSDHVVVGVAIRQQHLAEGDGACKVGKTHRDIVAGTEHAIGSGKYPAFDAPVRARRTARGDASYVVGCAYKSIGTGAE